MADEEVFKNIREVIGSVIGQVLVDVTQHDPDEFAKNQQSYVQLLFDNGEYLRFPIGEDGFIHSQMEDP